jgi:copper(I)-binding protein
MKILNQTLFALALTLGAIFSSGSQAQAHEIKIGNLVIHHPWIKQPIGNAAVASGYTTIDNTGKENDTLISISIENVATVQIHEMMMAGDVMKMTEMAKGLLIPAGKSVALKPKTSHIMLMGIKSPLMEGEQVKGTFTFAKAGKVDVDFEVVAPGADMPMKH